MGCYDSRLIVSFCKTLNTILYYQQYQKSTLLKQKTFHLSKPQSIYLLSKDQTSCNRSLCETVETSQLHIFGVL